MVVKSFCVIKVIIVGSCDRLDPLSESTHRRPDFEKTNRGSKRLRDEFQKKPPKIITWEIPERDMHLPPDYKFREARFVSNNANWLKQVSALVNKAGKP